MTEPMRIEVCVDCAMLIANGEGTMALANQIMARWPLFEWATLAIGDEEIDFSTADCDGCGSRLAGQRLEAYAIPA